jgi:Fe-S oxidoreductase
MTAGPEPRSAPASVFEATLSSPSGERLAEIRRAFHAALHRGDAVHLEACVHCGLCAESCHYARVDDDVRALPAYKLDLIASVYRHECSWLGRVAPHWVGARDLDAETVREWVDALFGRCTMCGRCMVNCAIGIDVPTLVRAARGALAAGGLVPPELQATVDRAIASGNNMGISRDDWVDTVRWLEDELRAELDDPAVRMPLDEPGATFLYTVNPREPKFFPLSLMAAAQIFNAAGERWTLSSENYDVTNYGFFSGDDEAAGTIAARLVGAARELGTNAIVLGECGHGFVSSRWHGPAWMGAAPDVTYRSVVEVVWEYVRDGRIVLDPTRSTKRFTLHDPCNLVRLGGIVEEPRRILAAAVTDFVEMTPSREQNFCCGGGGGQLSMTRFATRRLVAGRVKAEQIRATGAAVVASPCHNCVDQLTELSREYQLGVSVKTLCEIVADAMVR